MVNLNIILYYIFLNITIYVQVIYKKYMNNYYFTIISTSESYFIIGYYTLNRTFSSPARVELQTFDNGSEPIPFCHKYNRK